MRKPSSGMFENVRFPAGYCFEYTGTKGSHLTSSDEAWDTGMMTKAVVLAKLGTRRIDGSTVQMGMNMRTGKVYACLMHHVGQARVKPWKADR